MTVLYVALILLTLWFLYKVIYFLLHRRPLNGDEIRRLSAKRRKAFIDKNYNFTITQTNINEKFKSTMKAEGQIYRADLPLEIFPAYASLRLKTKKHEWIAMGFVSDTIVKYLWVNKGPDRFSVGFTHCIESLIHSGKAYGCDTLILFHNHPNINPEKYNFLKPSPEDINSAIKIGEYVNKLGMNWLDFVCERGNYLKYYQSFSDKFVPRGAKLSDINAENGVSPRNNYRLHRELGRFRF